MTPTQRTLDLLRKEGHHAEVVERWIPGANIRRDLWGFADVLSIDADGSVYGVQTTSASNVSARVRKITDSPLAPIVRKAGIKILVHGWRKGKRGWTCRVVDLS